MPDLIVADVETTGLDASRHVVLTGAWWNLRSDERGQLVFPHTDADIEAADPESLQVNGYAFRIRTRRVDVSGELTAAFHQAFARSQDGVLGPHKLAGSNPGFDERFLLAAFSRAGFENPQTWHYHPIDLGAYAAGVLGIYPASKLGLKEVCSRLEIPLLGHHGAAEDVTATGRCFLALDRIATSRWRRLSDSCRRVSRMVNRDRTRG